MCDKLKRVYWIFVGIFCMRFIQLLACLHEILVTVFLNLRARFGWKVFLSYLHFLVHMTSSAKKPCLGEFMLGYQAPSLFSFSCHLYGCFWKCLCLLALMGIYYNIKWFMISSYEKPFKLRMDNIWYKF
jgi:hypothetical protein